MRLPNPQTETVTLIKDYEDPARRYKLVYNYHPEDRDFHAIRRATSLDGLHWNAGPELPIDEFLEPGSFYKHNSL